MHAFGSNHVLLVLVSIRKYAQRAYLRETQKTEVELGTVSLCIEACLLSPESVILDRQGVTVLCCYSRLSQNTAARVRVGTVYRSSSTAQAFLDCFGRGGLKAQGRSDEAAHLALLKKIP